MPESGSSGSRDDPAAQRRSRHDYLRDAGRLPLYLAVFVFLGAFAVPFVWVNRRIGRGERIFLCLAGVLQTVFAVLLLIGAVIWMVWMIKSAATSGSRPPMFY